MRGQKLNKVLILAGATATGKTGIALRLAKKFKGDLISADSRQVYRGLDIVPGKDIPEGFTEKKVSLKGWSDDVTIYTDGAVSIWGLDMINPDQSWSAGEFKNFATAVIKVLHQQGQLPIVVGGTGLYLKSLTENLPLIPPVDPKIRAKLEKLSLIKLQQQLKQELPTRWEQMNQSDRNNPRRLVRALETKQPAAKPAGQSKWDLLTIGLQAPVSILEARIRRRVIQRLDQGLTSELKLLASYGRSVAAWTAIGYGLIERYHRAKLTRTELIDLWTLKEKQYAKRQLTWFKYQADLFWFDISQKNWQSRLVAKVHSWYHQTQ
jgi:tRNA dimethylallyltransferase